MIKSELPILYLQTLKFYYRTKFAFFDPEYV